MPNVKTAHGKFCRGLQVTLLFRANLQNASHFVGVAYPPNKISKTGLKMQAFSACFMKFCLALNSNQVAISGEVARYAPSLHLTQCRLFRPALFGRIRTSGVETAALRRIDRAWNLALQQCLFFSP